MGKTLTEHIDNMPDLEVGACLEINEALTEFIDRKPDVVVDFSLDSAVSNHGPAIVKAGLPYIIGATGISQDTLNELGQLADSHNTPVLIVPNFSLGANLMIKFAAISVTLMRSPVITERHHTFKKDCPSGTARMTAERVAQAREDAVGTYNENAPKLQGTVAGVPVHSVRGEGYLAEQQVQFSLPGETLTIEHRSIDRRCFMPGVVYAIRNIGKVVGMQTGLDTILDI
jgi:4-hydroxy-tetrahydrodipicolinate reductase